MDFEKWNYSIVGEGIPILFINGHFQSRSSWDPTVEDLGRFFKVITFEFPNQGQSPTDTSLCHLRDYASFAKGLIDFLGVPSTDLVVHGYSFGGNVLRIMSQELGMNFRAIIYGGIGSRRFAPFQVRRFTTWLEILDKCDFRTFASNVLLQVFSPDFAARHPQHFDSAINEYCRYYEHRPEAVRALTLAMRDFFQGLAPTKEKYLCDVYIIGAESDLLLPMNYVEEYGKEIGALETIALPGGHATRVEQHEKLSEAIGRIAMRYEQEARAAA